MSFRIGFAGMLLLAATASAGEPLPSAAVRYQGDSAETPSFQRHVLPLLGRLGCNGRACHGSFQGQGGFRLSLFGYDFKADHEALTTGDNPRVDLEVPADSMILQKATLAIPHKGGQRMKPESWEARLLLRWVQTGGQPVGEDEPQFERLEVTPSQIQFSRAGEAVPLKVLAHWTEGVVEDVTPLCRFRTNNEAIADVDADGVVTSIAPGDTDIVAFYDNGVVPVATILPVSDKSGDRYPAVATPTRIDELVVDKLRRLGVVPSETCTDAEFLRRVSLDVTGTLPTPAEVEAFLADSASDKRAKKVDQLLASPAYAAWWATRLCDMTGNNTKDFQERNVQAQQGRQWYEWIARRVEQNMPYDQLVAGILLGVSREKDQTYEQYAQQTSSYYAKENPADFAARETMPHFWARRTLNDPAERSLAVAYAFLGVRLQCAQCHKHPFDQWTQADFNEFTNFFQRVSYGYSPGSKDDANKIQASLPKDKKEAQRVAGSGQPYPWREIFVAPGGQMDDDKPRKKGKENKKKRPNRNTPATAKFLGGDEINIFTDPDPRTYLLTWFRDKENPYFARAFVNRVWAAYFGIGIIEPADDLNLANPPSNPALLDHLAQEFIAHNYDMRWLHREIVLSQAYQRSWHPNETNQHDERNFSRALPRRLPAEVAYDAVRQALASESETALLASNPDGRAITQAGGQGRVKRGNNNYALAIFGKPDRATNCDCERSGEASLLQTIYLRNDGEMLNNINSSTWLREVAGVKPSAGQRQKGDGGQGNKAAMRDAGRVQKRLNQLQKELKQAKKAENEKRVAELTEEVGKLRKRLARMDKNGEKPAQPEPAEVASAPQPSDPEKHAKLIREAYLRTLSRPPTDAELQRSQAHLASAADSAAGLKDLLWALLNTKEFIVNH